MLDSPASTTTAAVAPRPVWPAALLGLLLLVLLGPALLVVSNRIAAVTSWPYGVDHEEDYLLVHAARLRAGQWYMQPLEGDPPYIVGTYMPVMPLLVAPFLDPALPALRPGRLLAVASALALAGLLAVLVWRAGLPLIGALGLAGLFVAHRDVFLWMPLFRVDFTALLFGGMTVLIGGFAEREGRRWPLVAAGACAVLAFYTKQTTLAASLALFLWLIAMRGWRVAALWAAATGGVALALMAVGQALSPGSFWFHTVTANANTMSLVQLGVWWGHFARFTGWLMLAPVVGALCLGCACLATRERDWTTCTQNLGGSIPPQRGLILLYGLLACATFPGAAKLGAAENYMLEPLLGLLLTSGALFSGLREAKGMGSIVQRQLAWGGVVLMSLLLLTHTAGMVLSFDYTGRRGLPKLHWGVRSPGLAEFLALENVLALVARDPAGTYCERAAIALRHGSPLLMHPFICAQLAREGKWDEEGLLRAFASGRFRTLVVTEDIRAEAFQSGDAQYTPTVRAVIRNHYRWVAAWAGNHFTYHVWERSGDVPTTPNP